MAKNKVDTVLWTNRGMKGSGLYALTYFFWKIMQEIIPLYYFSVFIGIIATAFVVWLFLSIAIQIIYGGVVKNVWSVMEVTGFTVIVLIILFFFIGLAPFIRLLGVYLNKER